MTDILFESGSRFWTGDSVLCVAGPGVSLEAHFERKVLNTDGSEVVLKVNPSPPPPPLHPPRSTCLHALLALTPDADPAAPAPPPSPPPPLARSCRHQPRRCGAAGGSLAASTTSSSALCGPPSGVRHRSPGVGRRCAGGLAGFDNFIIRTPSLRAAVRPPAPIAGCWAAVRGGARRGGAARGARWRLRQLHHPHSASRRPASGTDRRVLGGRSRRWTCCVFIQTGGRGRAEPRPGRRRPLLRITRMRCTTAAQASPPHRT